jgi:OFA family oxalate/formate antiporter-like MFS transporter
MSQQRRIPSALIPRLPFFYGWIVLACACCAGFARQGPAVATLSIFITPMTAELDWSKTAISGAVSLGGILAALSSPFLGPLLDRHGARAILSFAVLATAVSVAMLSTVETLIAFYVLFCIGRMCFAGPFDLGIYGAINNWFVQRRPSATAIATLFQMIGLTAMPLIAMSAIVWFGDWRPAWIVVGATVLVIGFLPNWLFMVRRPEDVGLEPDGVKSDASPEASKAGQQETNAISGRPEKPKKLYVDANFTRGQALRTPAFWLLSLYTLLIYPVQAGVSLHQAPHLIEAGLDATIAATVVSTFSIFSAIAGLAYGGIARRLPISVSLASAGAAMATSAWLMVNVSTPLEGYIAAALFGIGIGALLTMLPIAWADTFGRRSFGAIRGIALTIQVLAQAIGPVLSGIFRDLTGDYTLSLTILAASAAAAGLVALLIRRPKPPPAPLTAA